MDHEIQEILAPNRASTSSSLHSSSSSFKALKDSVVSRSRWDILFPFLLFGLDSSSSSHRAWPPSPHFDFTITGFTARPVHLDASHWLAGRPSIRALARCRLLLTTTRCNAVRRHPTSCEERAATSKLGST